MQSKSDYDNAKLQGRNAGQTWIDQGNNAKDPKIKDAAYFYAEKYNISGQFRVDFVESFIEQVGKTANKSNFSIHSMHEWTEKQLKVLSPLTLVGLHDTKEYYLSGKMKVGDVIYLLGDPSTPPSVGKITKVGKKILTDEEGEEYPDIVVDLLDPYAIDDIDPESLEGASIAEITKEVERVLPVRLSNAELLKDDDIGYGFFPFGGFLITKHNYEKEYKDLVKEFIGYIKDSMNFSLRPPIRFR